jgi:hypothetical protein
MTSASVQRRGRFEALEQRQLLAGDVVVNVVEGNLLIRGDELDNKIMITAGADPGAFVVTGLDGTTVHEQGQPPGTDPVSVTGVRNIRAGLGDGNDLLAIVGANVGGGIAIRAGAGEDRVLIGTGADASELAGQLPADVSVSVHGPVQIGTAGGNDQIAVDDAMIGGRLGIYAGADDDSVALGGNAAVDPMEARLRVRGGIFVGLGAGNDELNMDRASAGGPLVARAGEGDDTITGTRSHSAAMLVFGDGGADTVSLDHLRARHLAIHTGEGADNVDVRDSAFAALGVALGNGEDTLTIGGLRARFAVLLGGDGEDTLDVASENHFVHEVVRGFETMTGINIHGPRFGPWPLASLISRLL